MSLSAVRELEYKQLPKGQTAALKTAEAAAFLGVTPTTIRRLIAQGYIRAFYIPNLRLGSKMIRLRIEEVHRLITENDLTGGLTGKNRSHWINPHTCSKIPVALAARILGMKGTAVSEAIQRGTLNPTPEGLHDYILGRRERELTTKIRAKYKARYDLLYKQVKRYEKKYGKN
jgi:excisionase family DNA binding protein